MFYKSQRSLSYFKRVHRRTKIPGELAFGEVHAPAAYPLQGLNSMRMIWLLVASACSLVLLQTVSRGQSSETAPSGASALSPQEQEAKLAAMREYALEHEGDSERGRLLFQDAKRLECSKCHVVNGSTTAVGPNLRAIGSKLPRSQMITSILEPSQAIAIGYGTSIVLTADGSSRQGILQRVTEEWVELLDSENKTIRIPTAEIEEQHESSQSVMPSGLCEKLTPEEFTDLVAYLCSLHQTEEVTTSGLTTYIPEAKSPATFTPAFGELVFDRPVWMGQVPPRKNGENGDAPPQNDRFVVLEVMGRAFLVSHRDGHWVKDPLFEITDAVRHAGGSGLLGMAFHPQFSVNGRYFIKYQTLERNQLQTAIEERRMNPEGSDLSEAVRRVMTIPTVTQDHNGGGLAFGPDGYLYIGMGDSGPQRDPEGHGQDLSRLQAKILRIDVDRTQGDVGYAIPPDNPFVNNPQAKPEIWAYGFREPWRISFDPENGDCWVGDVGQDRIEEIAIVRSGENHGWNVYEGHTEYSSRYQREGETYVLPVFSYPRTYGASITGGYVYRGNKTPHMIGWYITGDYESRRIWALQQTDRQLTKIVAIGQAPSRIVSFAEDSNRQLYLIGFDDGIIHSINLDGVDTTPMEIRTLVETSRNNPALWRYTTETPPANWMDADFDDSHWKLGPAGFGTPGTPNAVVRTDWSTSHIWLRRRFDLPADASPSTPLQAMIHHDEDVEMYLNGVEALRANRWTTSYVEIPIAREATDTLRSERNVIAIHCRQNSGGQFIDAGLVQYIVPSKDVKAKPRDE